MKKLLSFGAVFLISILLYANINADVLTRPEITGTTKNIWKQEGTTASPADDVTAVDFNNTNFNYTSINNWVTAVSTVKFDTGVHTHSVGETSCKVTVNAGDDTLIDIAECHYLIQGIHDTFNAMPGIDPEFGVGENSKYVGVTLGGYTTQTALWTVAQKRTVIPIVRLNTPSGETGPGSMVSLLRDDRYFVSERDYKDKIWTEEAIGSLYVKGGELFVNATSNLILGQYSGILYNAQRERHLLAEFSNMSAIFVSHTTGGVPVATKMPMVINNTLYDTGTGLVAVQANKWTKVSILKAPQGSNGAQEGGWFYIYGNAEYGTQAEAEAADFNYSIFDSQATSGLVPLVDMIIKKDGVTLGTDIFINDRRPCRVCRVQ